MGAGVAGCSSSSESDPTTTSATTAAGPSPDVLAVIAYPATGVQIFRDYYAMRDGDDETIVVPDALKDAGIPEQVDEPLANVVGTAPTAASPNQEAFVDLFTDAYGKEPSIFTPHSFDAVAILLLANVAAGANDGTAVRDQMRRVTNGDGMEVGPGTLVEGVRAVARGEAVDYVGASGRTDFDERGDPAAAAYEVWKFAPDADAGFRTLETLDFTGSPGGPRAEESPGGTDRTAKVGLMFPVSGDLGSVGPPMRQAGELAARIVDEGDVSIDVDVGFRDTETSPQAGVDAAHDLVDAGYPCVAGPASSGVNQPVATQALIPHEVVGCSPASTALSVSFLEDDGYVFRTAPSDLLQGQVLADVAAERLDGTTTATMYVDNDYGRQLSDQYTTSFSGDYDGSVWQTIGIGKERDSYSEVLASALEKGK